MEHTPFGGQDVMDTTTAQGLLVKKALCCEEVNEISPQLLILLLLYYSPA
jgi:hypothetical protein